MGIKKTKSLFTRKQMKFYSLIALICGASAIKIAHKPASNNLVSMKTYTKLHSFTKSKLKAHQPDWDLTPEQEADIEEWIVSELTTGEGTITAEEAHTALTAFAEHHGFTISDEEWEELGDFFGSIDTNNDNQIDLEEMLAAME